MPAKIIELETMQVCADCQAQLNKGDKAKQYTTRQGSLVYYCYPKHKIGVVAAYMNSSKPNTPAPKALSDRHRQEVAGPETDASRQSVAPHAEKTPERVPQPYVSGVSYSEQKRKDIFASVALQQAVVFWAGKGTPKDIDATAQHFFELLMGLVK
jgi:hypothetical protein